MGRGRTGACDLCRPFPNIPVRSGAGAAQKECVDIPEPPPGQGRGRAPGLGAGLGEGLSELGLWERG